MNITVFWDVAPCRLLKVDGCFKGAYCHSHQGDESYRRDDGGSKHLRNINRFLPHYMAHRHGRVVFISQNRPIAVWMDNISLLCSFQSRPSSPTHHLLPEMYIKTSDFKTLALKMAIVIFVETSDNL
jgi:hypothetical protein